mmetsp:Transcript_79867/g.124542  ORF Transcript_79867/g.124542 Transcript_79867/m.124542 type:complete len:93 (+) Transcript_79867:49-327(+)
MQPTATKGQVSVLPNSRSIMLICLIACGQIMHFMNESKNIGQVDTNCVARFGSVFPFCLPDDGQNVDTTWDRPGDLEKLLEVSKDFAVPELR